ncbi:MAG: glutamate--tRNA ligase [Caulobacteraceae bacterium]
MPKPVVTRIAPSPTGAMHIGNARAALFNWLYAKHTGGTFLLRIEDTDRERSTEASVQVIFDSLTWLGLQWDGEPVFQFPRAAEHKKAVDALLASGHAYRCYMTVAEADALKEQSRADGHALRSPWRDKAPGPIEQGAPHVVRFKTPMDGDTVVEDLVRETVRFPNKDLEDFVLLRTDGTVIYNLAVTVDDHDMGVTHVIRGEEHLSNAGRQTLLYKALGWEVPVFAHLPLILGKDGGKLSKRHGAQSVAEFRDMGYLPEAVRNYLAKLGWGHGDDELFTDAQAIEWFDVADVVKAGARLDWDKLNHVNNWHIRQADDARLADLVEGVLAARQLGLPADTQDRLLAAIPAVKEGAKTIPELADLCLFALQQRPLTLDPKAQGMISGETRDRLERLLGRLGGVNDWAAEQLLNELRGFAETEGVGMGKFGPALRAAISGGVPAPDLASALAILGRDESLGRLKDALSHVR